MKKIAALLALTLLTGCDAADVIPSFWDDNQSASIINGYQDIANIDCDKPQLAQAKAVEKDLQWFLLYSQSKGMMQGDVIKLITPMHDTAVEWVDRASKREPSKTYCNMKKEIMLAQAQLAASAVLGRF